MIKKIIILSVILILGILSRFYNLNWDSGSMLHPDERFLIMVTEKLVIPNSLQAYLDTSTSNLNPHNIGFNFYVYGTLPIIILKLLANNLLITNITELLILGRHVSAAFDVLTAVLVYLIAKKISPKTNLSIFALLSYFSITLAIQLSHFFTVDTSLVFFITLSAYFIIRSYGQTKNSLNLNLLIAGISFGLAVSSKISALYFLPVVAVFFIQRLIIHKKVIPQVIAGCIFLFFSLFALRMAYPYLFSSGELISSLNSEVIADWKELNYFYSHSTYEDPNSYIFPPATMFLSTIPIVFPLINLINYGLGPIFSIYLFLSITLFIIYYKSHRLSLKKIFTSPWLLLVTWAAGIFIIQGVQFLLYLRYFYPTLPALSIISAFLLHKIYSKNKQLAILSASLLFIWPLSYISIYTTPHTRVQASDWIYSNLPTGSTIAFEHWDDPLPLYRPNQINSRYTLVELPMFDKESQNKWRKIYSTLNSSDYLVISSNRVYASTTAIPARYSINKKYYDLLFSNQLGFSKIAEFTSRPRLPFPVDMCINFPFSNYGKKIEHNLTCQGIEFVDDFADESFTVYDHPKVLIFKKTGSIPNLGVYENFK